MDKRKLLIWPVILVFARFFLAMLIQLIVAIGYYLAKDANPIESAGQWFTVYGNVIDIVCLYLIYRQIKKENLGLFDLVNIDKQCVKKDIGKGFLYALLFLPVSIIGMILSSLLIYGNPEPVQTMGGIPLWAAIYSVIIFPIIWGFSEQVTYQGYSLNRLNQLFNNSMPAILIVSFGWMLQHCALPFKPDFDYMLFRMISYLPLTILMPVLYLKTKRLLPFIISHWLLDLAAAVTGTLVPLLINS